MRKTLIQLIVISHCFTTTFSIAQGTWTNYSKDNVLLSHRIQAIMNDSKGNMWFGTAKGLQMYDGANWFTYTKKEGLPHVNITYLFEDSRGIVWVGTALGLARIENGKITTLGKKNDCQKMYFFGVNYIFEDSKNRLWVGATNLILFENNKCKLYSKKDGAIYKSGVHLIFEDPKGYIWFASAKIKGGGMWTLGSSAPNDGGISRYDGTSWHVFSEKDGLPAPNRCLFKKYIFDKKGNIWFGSCHLKTVGVGVGSLMKYDGESWTYFSNKNVLNDDCVNNILLDSKDNIWVGTNRGVNVYDGSSWKGYSQDDSITDNQIRVMKEDSKGNIWIGSENGLCVFNGTQWKKFEEGKELPDKFISAIHEDRNGNIWVGTGDAITKGGGVAKFDGEGWTIYTREDELAGKLVYRIEEDSRGNLWFITLTGISKYTPDEKLIQSNL